jgi:hypothetical protein
MPADLVPETAIPDLAEQVTPAMRRVLQLLRERGFLHNGPALDEATAVVLRRLASLGLVDPGFSTPTDREPFIWVSNSNGTRVLRHLAHAPEAQGLKLTIHPRAETALTSLPQKEQVEVLVAAESLLGRDPATWPREEAARLDADEPIFLLRVSPELRAFVRPQEDGGVELFDIVREDTLRLFLERTRVGGA